MRKHIIYICDYYSGEVDALELTSMHTHVQIECFSGHCCKTPVSWKALLEAYTNNDVYIDIFCGACQIALADTATNMVNLHIHSLRQCFQMVADEAFVNEFIKQGYYIVTPGWLRKWRVEIERWGFSKATVRPYFSEFAQKILLLDTGIDPEVSQHLQDFADFVGQSYETIPVGLDYINLVLQNTIMSRQIEDSRLASDTALCIVQQELSQYAMSLDLLRTLSPAKQENGAVEGVIELFTTLFAPKRVTFTPQSTLTPGQREIHQLPDGFILPIFTGRGDIGTLTIDGLSFPEYRERYANIAMNLSSICGMTIENARHYEEIRKLAETDSLTGLTNRRYLFEYIAREWRRLCRENKPLSLIVFDVDCFKHYNDQYGHLAGDDCLRAIAHVLSSSCKRPADLVARYGGEEFIVVLPDTSLEGAVFLAESIRKSIYALQIVHEDSPADSVVTVSGGIASIIPSSAATLEKLIESADSALYCAKKNGRNRIVSSDDTEDSTNGDM